MENSAKTTKKECHNPRAGKPPSGQALFYFTPLAPCGGETRRRRTRRHPERISIHSPLVGARRLLIKHGGKVRIISIHSPRVGARRPAPLGTGLCHNFNPLAPCGGGTQKQYRDCVMCSISIHSPRVGARRQPSFSFFRSTDFNPLAPCGGETKFSIYLPYIGVFQSTRPVWGRDRAGIVSGRPVHLFQSTRPVWGRDFRFCKGGCVTLISIHSPRVGARRHVSVNISSERDFNPLAPCGGETERR